MRMLFKRIAIYICIPAGLILLIGPLNTFQHEYVEREFVFISAHMDDAPDAYTLKGHQLDRYPELRKILQERSRWFKNLIPREAAAFKAQAGVRKNPYSLLAVRTQQNAWQREGTRLPPDEWRETAQRLFGTQNKVIRFRYKGLVFESAIKVNEQFADIQIPGLDRARRFAGGLMLAAGLFLYATLGVKQNGISVGRPGVIFLWDMIVILVSLVFSHAAIDFMFVKLFNTHP